MKAPINFTEKIKGYYIKSNGRLYKLGDDAGWNNRIWVYPDYPTNNVFRIDFNWREETYNVNVVKKNEGSNFHNYLPAVKFPAHKFLSFSGFTNWLEMEIFQLFHHFN